MEITFTCSNCGKKFNLNKDISFHPGLKGLYITCDNCGEAHKILTEETFNRLKSEDRDFKYLRETKGRPYTLKELKDLVTETYKAILVNPILKSKNNFLISAILDSPAFTENEIVAIYGAGPRGLLEEKDYGKTWLAYPYII